MTTSHNINEKFLYEIWSQQKFEEVIKTHSGEEIKVLDPGELNNEKNGPDFKNAKIKIGDVTYTGDIEIDKDYLDWKNHGHHVNKKFNGVILHATLNDLAPYDFVFTQNGRRVNTISFEDFLEESIRKQLSKAIVTERDKRINKIACAHISDLVPEEKKRELLHDLGLRRLSKKCDNLVHRLKEIIYRSKLELKEPDVRYDPPAEYFDKKIKRSDLQNKQIWTQLFYELIFEALGYTHNKIIMQRLAAAVDLEFINKIKQRKDFRKTIEAVYYVVSGLFPDTDELFTASTSEYARKLYEKWIEVKELYDGEYFSEEDWHFGKLRPQNYPTIRIAAGAVLVDKLVNGAFLKDIIKKFKEIQNFKVLRKNAVSDFIVSSEGYWSSNYLFSGGDNNKIRYFTGRNRADEIFINVLIPFMYIYFDLLGQKNNARKIIKLYSYITANVENSLVNKVYRALKLDSGKNKVILYQGMIELFRGYCTKNACEECPIGNEVFESD